MGLERARIWAAATAVVGGLAVPSSALAAPSAYDQYVPLVPSASGPAAPGGHGHKGGSVPLSPSAAATLRQAGGRNQSALETIATSHDLGAMPVAKAGGGSAAAGGAGSTEPGSNGARLAAAGRGNQLPGTSSTLTAAKDALGRSPVLPLMLFAALAGALVAGTLRRRRA